MGWTGLIQSPCEQDFISWGCLVQPCVYLQQHIAVFELRQKELRHLARISNVGSCSDFIPNLFWIVTSSLVIIWQCNQQVTNEPHESCYNSMDRAAGVWPHYFPKGSASWSRTIALYDATHIGTRWFDSYLWLDESLESLKMKQSSPLYF